MTTRARACSVGERENEQWHCTDFFQRKEQPVVPTLSMCRASSLSTKELERANDHVSRVFCSGDGEKIIGACAISYNVFLIQFCKIM